MPPDVGPADVAITSLPAAEPETYTLKPAEPLPAAPPPVLPATPSGAPKTCPGCHRQLPADARLCVECGIDLCSGRPVLMTDDDNLDRAYEYAERAIRWISWIVGVGVYPVASEAFGLRKPWVVRGIALLTILVSLWYMVVFIYNPDPNPELAGLMLWWGQPKPVNAAAPPSRSLGNDDYDELAAAPELTAQFSPQQIFTHVLLHADLLHLAGNMLFLMVLGSRVNALLGNLLTIVAYPLLAVGSSLIDMVAGAQRPLSPSLGASGAVMGLAGMYLVLFPIHRVHMAAWWRWGLVGRFNLNLKIFAVRGFWVVLAYIALDVAAVAFGLEDGIGHWAHIGGFLSGVVLALGLLVTRLVNARGGDLLTALLKHRAWVIIGHPNRPERLWW